MTTRNSSHSRREREADGSDAFDKQAGAAELIGSSLESSDEELIHDEPQKTSNPSQRQRRRLQKKPSMKDKPDILFERVFNGPEVDVNK